MAFRTVANDNRIAEIGDRLSLKERNLIDVYRSLSAAQTAVMRQEFARGARPSSRIAPFI